MLPSLQAQAFFSDSILSSCFQIILYLDLLAIMLSTLLVLQSVLNSPPHPNPKSIYNFQCMSRLYVKVADVRESRNWVPAIYRSGCERCQGEGLMTVLSCCCFSSCHLPFIKDICDSKVNCFQLNLWTHLPFHRYFALDLLQRSSVGWWLKTFSASQVSITVSQSVTHKCLVTVVLI